MFAAPFEKFRLVAVQLRFVARDGPKLYVYSLYPLLFPFFLSAMSSVRTAVILRLKPSGLVYALDDRREAVGFVFGKLQGYKGQTLRELSKMGIREGARLEVEYDRFGLISQARLARPVQQASR